MSYIGKFFSTAIALPIVFLANPAAAQSPISGNSGWQVDLTVYTWASGMNGDIGAVEGAEPVSVDMSFGDIFDHLKFAGMGAMQARHNRFVMVADISYVNLGASEDLKIRDVDLIQGDMKASTFTASALAGYRIADRGPVTVDLMAGARINSISSEIKLSGPLRSVEGDVDETWIDPIIGTHVSIPISPRWSLAMYGDVGGFGIASDFTWQLLGAVQYDFSERWRASAGWRHYSVDYDKGAFLYDVSLSGPVLGIRYSF